MPAAVAVAELEDYRPALTGHCYRMLGSATDADDAVQETMLRAWRGLPRFDGRSSLRTWMYRIATNVCLDLLAGRKRRARPVLEGPAGGVDDPLHELPQAHWIEPIPDIQALPGGEDPAQLAILRQSIRLAFVAALQFLTPRQRAVLLMVEVLGSPVAEAAAALRTTPAAVNSTLQRARATLAERRVPAAAPLSGEQRRTLERYVDAFHRYDVDRLVGLLCADATLSMPPYSLWLQGPGLIREWLLGRGSGCRGSRLEPVAACGSPAFAQYRMNPGGGYHAWAIIVLELAASGIAGWNSFLDTASLFPRFGLPLNRPD